MKLSIEDVELFYTLRDALLLFVNKKFKTIEDFSAVEDLKHFPPEKIARVRNVLWDNINIIDTFIQENPFAFSKEELEIVDSWKFHVKGEFFLVKHLKKYSVFLESTDTERAYGVLGLYDAFDQMVGNHLPLFLETVLLPFKNQITYDGFLGLHHIIFGSGSRRRFNHSYQEIKSKFGVITSLPFSLEEKKQDDTEMLKFYLKNKRNREMYWTEINDLISKDPQLKIVYHQEIGKIKAQRFKKNLHEIGINKAWFAVLHGMIIASGPSKEELEKNVMKIIPREKKDFVYIFQLK